MSERTIFVDMDGVLADFDTGYALRFGERPNKIFDNADWDLVRQAGGFYRDLPPMPDFAELWSGIAHLRPIILTGVPRSVEEAPANKRAWIDRHIGPNQPAIFCASRDKSLHIRAHGDVLIDDWDKHRQLWIDRGGRWITHLSAASSLQELDAVLAERPMTQPDPALSARQPQDGAK